MRTYLVDNDNNEIISDLVKTIKHSSELVEFEFQTIVDGNREKIKRVFVRRLSGNYFSSFDGIKWKKMARQILPNHMVNIDEVYKLYRGYMPSGLSKDQDSAFFTQMPGKVVKINVKVGEKISKGQTVIVLEAMKMENEIKSAVDGVVNTVYVKEGDTLDQGVLMIDLVNE